MASTPNTIVPTQIRFWTFLWQQGAVLHKKYGNLDNNNGGLGNLQADPRYPNNPDRQDILSMFEYPANGAGRDETADPTGYNGTENTILYSDTLETYFIPPTTNDYVFFAAGADINDVYLSTDANPANMVNIAQCSGWTNPRDWLVSQCGTADGLRSDTYTRNAWPGIGAPLIHLDGGQKYYLFAFHHRFTWSGGDDFAVTWKYNGDPVPVGGEAPVLTGSQVGFYLDPTGASVTFTTQPADKTILQGRTATFTAAATGQSPYGTTVQYQWQTAPSGSTSFTNIPGAVNASYTTAVMGVADSGRQYKVIASVPGYSQASRTAILTVNADTIPPRLVASSAMLGTNGTTFDVGITFDEPLDAASAQTIGNYSIPGGSVSAAKYFAGSPGVVLTVSGLTVGSAYTVTVVNVGDPYGNHMTSANLPLTVGSMRWGVIGGNEAALGNGVLPVAPNAFDVYSDGVTEWGAYDEATLVYEQVTGDFDKRVRVEFQDASSEWARAGLVAREVLNFGVGRIAQEGSNSQNPPWDGVASRYQKVHVNPVTTAMGTRGNNSWEGNRRLDTGSQSTSAGGGGTPAYPNAWCRLQRVGQTFNVYRSNNGSDWVQLGSTTWGVTDTNKIVMPATLYVGPDYSPENGNVSTGFKNMFVAKFRDYGNTPTAISYVRTPTGMTITFSGVLQSATSLSGPWTDVTSTSPYATTTTGPQMFFRAKQ